MSGARARKATPHEEEEHVNHERWMVSYADMVTLLMVLFIVLFAISEVDVKKYDELANGLAESFGAPITALQDSTTGDPGVLASMPDPINITIPAKSDLDNSSQAEVDAAAAARAMIEAEAQQSYNELAAIRDRLQADLTTAGYPLAARYEIDQRGLVVHIIADALLFDAESDVLRAEGRAILQAAGPTLRSVTNQLRVEGHANSIPVTPGGRWASNWGLSGARAARITEFVQEADGIPGTRLESVGYSDTRPLVPDSDPTAMTVNRRVDIVVVSSASAAANELLPVLDKAAS